LDYAFGRYYEHLLGRFISADPVGGDATNPQSLNRCAYVLNNPIRFTDPSGLHPPCPLQSRASERECFAGGTDPFYDGDYWRLEYTGGFGMNGIYGISIDGLDASASDNPFHRIELQNGSVAVWPGGYCPPGLAYNDQGTGYWVQVGEQLIHLSCNTDGAICVWAGVTGEVEWAF
jgi:hypothetical protein